MRSSFRRSNMVAPARLLIAAALVVASVVVPVAPAVADSTFLITGRGYGHGIGMSQWGAKGYADQGKTYSWILLHYYGNNTASTTIRTYSSISTGTVKVNLDPGASAPNGGYTKSAWTLTPADTTKYLVVNGRKLTVGRSYVFKPSGSNVLVVDKTTNASFTATDYANVTEGGVTTSLVRVAEGTGNYNRLNQRYRGTLKITSNGAATPRVKLVDYLSMDSYLYGVVPGESPSSWPAEALKAQAVAARSYANRTGGEMYCTTAHQVYLGFDAEVASTNSAVSSTAGKVVYSGGVVKTFFFSSSGGHTANIEDVWVGATPQSYYTGVVDADISGGSADAKSWGPAISYTGTALASRLRAEGSSYSRPSPAIVTGVTIHRAPSGSGFAQYVTFAWSDGQTTKPTGDWVRSALGLKSTKFTIAKKSDVKRTEQNSSRVVYRGTWRTASSSVHSGGSYVYSSSKGATSAVKFKGAAIAVIGPKYRHFGRANVYLDGKYLKTISAYAASPAYRQRLFYLGGLSSTTTHTVSVKVTGTKDPASQGVYFGIDAYDVTAGDTIAP